MRLKIIAFVVIVVFSFTSCTKEAEQRPNKAQPAVKAAHEVTVKEVVNVTEYSYLKVADGDKEYWIACPKAEIKVGEVLT